MTKPGVRIERERDVLGNAWVVVAKKLEFFEDGC